MLTQANYMVVSEVFSQGFVTDRSAPLCCLFLFRAYYLYYTPVSPVAGYLDKTALI